MKRPLRRVGYAIIVMVVLLLGNVAYTQVIKADDYRADPNNKRTLVAEYSRQRGQITAAGGKVLARSVPVDDQYSYQREYPEGAVYANPVGYYSMRYGPTGIERNQNEILSGEAPELIAGQLSDLITGRDPRGGNVQLTLEPAVQQAAYSAMTDKNYVGAVVAIEPSTGNILAMVSTPSFDPNPLASHSDATQRQAYNDLVNADPSPLLNRAISAVYPPGSTFKLVIAAAALQNGLTPDTSVTGQATITLPGRTVDLDVSGITHLAAGYDLKGQANGNAASAVKGTEFGADGTVYAIYEDGGRVAAFKVPLGDVASPDNLTPRAGNVFETTPESGSVQVGFATTGGRGTIKSGALEQSNVDVSAELTAMIESQTVYTANSKVFMTSNEMLDTLMNLKR